MANIEVKILEKPLKPPFLLIKPDVTEKEFFEFANEDISCKLIDGMLMNHSPASIDYERYYLCHSPHPLEFTASLSDLGRPNHLWHLIFLGN